MEEVLKEGLLRLIEVVETAAPELWAIGVKQAMIQGVAFLAGFLAFLGLAIFTYYHSFRMLAEWKASQYSRYSEKEFIFFIGLFATCFLVTALVCGYGAVGRFLNPEYYAINLLMDLVK